MKKHSLYKIAAILLFAAIAMAVPQFAQAATLAGTTISNTATVNFNVGTVPQTAQTGSTAFVVDRVIYLTVTKQSDVTSAPSSTFQAVQFLVTNNSNTAIRFALSPVSKASNTWALTTPDIYLDVNSNGKYDAGDTHYGDAGTFGNVASGASITVLITGDILSTATNSMYVDYDLVATAVDFGTLTVSLATGGTKSTNLNTVMTILGDGAGTAVGDIARDGKHSATGRFNVTAAGLTVTKTATFYSDPISGTSGTNPGVQRAIPGAVIIYTVTITNAAGGAAASSVHLTDSVPTNTTAVTTYDDGVIIGCGNGGAISINGAAYACAGANVWSGSQIDVTTASIPAGNTWALKYQVTVQ